MSQLISMCHPVELDYSSFACIALFFPRHQEMADTAKEHFAVAKELMAQSSRFATLHRY